MDGFRPTFASLRSTVVDDLKNNRSVSSQCMSIDHEECPHIKGYVIDGGRRYVDLCLCQCHIECSLAGMNYAESQRWMDECTCPGAATAKRIHLGAEREIDIKSGQINRGRERETEPHPPSIPRTIVEHLQNILEGAREGDQSDSRYESLVERLSTFPLNLVVRYLVAICITSIGVAARATGRHEDDLLNEIASIYNVNDWNKRNY